MPQLKMQLSVREAQESILAALSPCPPESLPLEKALGRALAQDVLADRDSPPFDVSAMDGYAVRAEDIAHAPAALPAVADIKAGDKPAASIGKGQCARIMTGAPLPEGADTVVRVEDTAPAEGGRVEFRVATPCGTDIRRRGENLARGQAALAAHTEITPAALALLASAKAPTVSVFGLPRVAILSTGDELEALDAPCDPGKVPDANSYALMAQTQALGIRPDLLGIARDDPAELAGFLARGLGYDVFLVSGGTSVGVHDHVRPGLEALGVEMRFWKVEMRPGHPVAFGVAPGCLVFCLPGNPVSSMVCFGQFVLPALRAMMGMQRRFRRVAPVRLQEAVRSKAGRVEFVRVCLSPSAGGWDARLAGGQGSADLQALSRADGLLIVPAPSQGFAAGDMAFAQLLEAGAFQEEGFGGDFQ